eukprot:Platyproteum_vivax@DN4990_c0_g1_i1.p1
MFRRPVLLGAFCRQLHTAQSSVAFIGLGNMGRPMAANLLQRFPVTVTDVDETAIPALTRLGATSGSVEDLARCDVIVTMLPATTHVSAVYEQLLPLVRPNTLLIDCSSIDPTCSRRLHQQAADRGLLMVDAPVSGGVVGATNQTLTFMAGGTEDSYEKAKPYLQAMGKAVVHCGKGSSGHAVKMCNNLILGNTMVAVAEAFQLVQAMGVDPKLFQDVLATSSGRCWSADTNNPVPGVLPNAPASRNYEPGFKLDLMMKDLRTALAASETVDLSMPLTELTLKTYEETAALGSGNMDFSCVYLNPKRTK